MVERGKIWLMAETRSCLIRGARTTPRSSCAERRFVWKDRLGSGEAGVLLNDTAMSCEDQSRPHTQCSPSCGTS